MKDREEFLGWFDDDDGERMRLSVVSFLSRAFRMVSSRRRMRSVKGGGSGEYMLLFVIDLLHGVRVGSRDWKGDILGCRRFLLLLLLLLQQNAKKVAIYNFEIMSHGFDQWSQTWYAKLQQQYVGETCDQVWRFVLLLLLGWRVWTCFAYRLKFPMAKRRRCVREERRTCCKCTGR